MKEENCIRKVQKIARRCFYNDKGHCRFGRACLFQHASEVCLLGQECPCQTCPKRHPLPCRYGVNCQFGPTCSFHHSYENHGRTTEEYEEKKTDGEGIDANDDMTNENEMTNEAETVEMLEEWFV